MTPSFIIISLVVGILSSSPLTLLVSWLLRRDASVRSGAVSLAVIADLERRLTSIEVSAVTQKAFDKEFEAARIVRADMDRRVHSLEVDGVSKREFEMLNKRLEEILTDIRELRGTVDAIRAGQR